MTHFSLNQNQILLLEPGKEFTFESLGGVTTHLSIPTDILVDFSGGRKPKSRIVDATRGMNAVLMDAMNRLTKDLDAFVGERPADVEEYLVNAIASTFVDWSRDDLKGHKTRLLERAKRYIKTNISDPDLNSRAVADHLGVSVRTVHHLFEHNTEGCAAYIRKRRLQHVFDALKDGPRDVSVGQIAFGFGFNNMSHFSKVFREVYGVHLRRCVENDREIWFSRNPFATMWKYS